MRAASGFQIGESKYKNRLPPVVDQTYALRSINYGTSDILVAFRVARKNETDGSLIIVWKELKRFPKPELKREINVSEK
jgi:hypothetical protein